MEIFRILIMQGGKNVEKLSFMSQMGQKFEFEYNPIL
jgi:hypothetical protein